MSMNGIVDGVATHTFGELDIPEGVESRAASIRWLWPVESATATT